MTRTEKENLVPVWERITISLEEAAAYSGIGVRKLRDMTDKPEAATAFDTIGTALYNLREHLRKLQAMQVAVRESKMSER